MLNRTTLFALAAALAVAIAPAAALAKGGHHGGKGGHHGGKHAHHHHHKHHHKHVRWHRWKYPVLIGSAGIATYAATTTTGSCNCLTKSYLEDGTVVFKDLCTQEMAMNGPAVEKQAAK